MSLSQFFASDYFLLTRHLAEIDEAILGCAKIYAKAGESIGHGWAYEFGTTTTRYSASTSGMIGSALTRLLSGNADGRASQSYKSTGQFPSTKLANELRDALEQARIKTQEVMAREAMTTMAEYDRSKKKAKKPQLVFSTAAGPDDPSTLGWLWDVLSNSDKADSISVLERIKEIIHSKANTLEGTTKGPFAGKLLGYHKEMTPGDSSYIVLRYTRLLNSVLRKDEKNQELAIARLVLARHFEGRLHTQLSFKEIPDSRFDAAEAAFCLEGLLLTNPSAVDRAIVKRVAAVMEAAQKNNASWRAETPMLTSITGAVLIPVSVEVANSFLNSITLIDGDRRLHDTVSEQCLQLFIRYWQWLYSRRTERDVGAPYGTSFGWHSEHVNDKSSIHLWETSQVLEFLLSLRDQVARQLGRHPLILSNVMHEWGEKKKPIEKDSAQKQGNERQEQKIDSEKKSNHAKILDAQFLIPHSDAKKVRLPYWSALLFGPPGTGKTSLARDLARNLELPFVTITVSDFLDDGYAEMEARAKHLFAMLNAQPKTVVLFDEFDPFLLDRSSQLFRMQDSRFQLMTNGMLPKLHELRSSERVIFFFATNYLERIDPAIRRRGRFDSQIHVTLPNWSQRRACLLDLFSELFCAKDASAARTEAFDKLLNSAEVICGQTCLFTYSDLAAAMKSVADSMPEDTSKLKDPGEILDVLTKTVDEFKSATQLSSYESRFNKHDKSKLLPLEQTPLEEFFGVALLKFEAKDRSVPDVVKAIFKDELLNLRPDIEKSIQAAAKANDLLDYVAGMNTAIGF